MKKFLLLINLFLILFINNCIAQSGWYWQNPYPQGNDLYSISFISVFTSEGWAVGPLGTAIHTSNGGITWELVDLGTTEILNCVYMHSDNQIFIVGNNGLIIYIYNDGGTMDITQQTSNTTEDLRSITSNINGCPWIAGDDGTILRTTDMGITWTEQNPFYHFNLYSLHNIECTSAWAAGFDGFIMNTTDWGNTWTYQPTPTNHHLFSINIGTFQHIRAVGNVGTILLSTDEGATWTIETSGTTSNLQDVFNIGYARAYTVGDDGVILETTDIGEPWIQRNSGVTEATTLWDIADQFGSDSIWVVGRYGSILKNSGVGTDFEVQNEGTMKWIKSVHFFNENIGWAVGGDAGWSGTHFGVILNTTDGGITWEENTTSTPFNDLHFADDENGWAVGEDGLIWHTFNGGAGWNSQTSPVSSDLNAVCAVDEYHAWAVGDYGEIIKTTNAGGNWVRQTSTTANWLYGVHFVNDNNGWAVGLDSTVLHTTDGGTNWVRQITNASNGFLYADVQFMDEMIGWVVGVNGSILLTTDGSATWQEIPSGVFESLWSVYFIDYNNGWIAGDVGTVLRTRDGGFTWEKQFSGVATNTLTSVCFIDTMNGWVTGEGGTILHTTDGGGIVSVETNEITSTLPESFLLSQNYPNPFNPSTTIKWQLPDAGLVSLKIYDVLGREVTTLVKEEKQAGKYQVEFNGDELTSGIYFYRLQAGNFIQTKKMILLK